MIRGRRRLLGASLILTSVALGIWAHDLAQAEALGSWLRLHPPSSHIWRHALESRGYRSPSELKAIQRASRTLPSLVDEEGSVWASSDASWIAVYQSQPDGQTSRLYCVECLRPPTGWRPLGRGWEAFDPALALADAAAGKVKPSVKTRAYTDPRELRY